MVNGGLAGGLWSVEIWAGGLAMLGRAAERAVGGAFVLLAVAAVAWAGMRWHDPGTARRAGLLAGLAGGVVGFVVAAVRGAETGAPIA